MPKVPDARRRGRLVPSFDSGGTMFDGNHRVRREVNLGGNRRRGGGGAGRKRPGGLASAGGSSRASGIPDRKTDILENARVEREKRREEKRRNDAARDAQRCYRGWRGRGEAAVAATARLRALEGVVAIRERASLLASLSGPALRPLAFTAGAGKAEEEEIDGLLALGRALEGAATSSSDGDPWTAAPPGDYDDDAEVTARSNFVRGRLVRRALAQLRELSPSSSSSSSSKAVAIRGATVESMDEGDGASSEGEASAVNDARASGMARLVARLVGGGGGGGNNQHAILLPVLRNGPGTAEREGSGLVALFLAYRDWIWSSSSGRPSGSDKSITEVVNTLTRLAFAAADVLGTAVPPDDEDGGAAALAVLGAALFCSPPPVFQSAASNSTTGTGTVSRRFGAPLSSLAGALLVATTPSPSTEEPSSERRRVLSLAREAAVGTVAGREVALLSNAIAYLDGSVEPRHRTKGNGNGSSKGDGSNGAMDISAACSLARLLRHVLARRSGTLTVLASLSAAGEDVRALLLEGGPAAAAATMVDLTNDDDESSDSDSDDEDDTDAAPSASSGASSAQPPAAAATGAPSLHHLRRARSSRHSRQQIQTVPKLERKYRTEAGRARRNAVEEARQTARSRAELEAAVDLCEKLAGGGVGNGNGNGGPTMVRLGEALLVSSNVSGSASAAAASSVDLEAARAAYCETLSDLLQFSSASSSSTSVGGASTSPLLSALAFRPRLLGALWSRWSSSSAVASVAGKTDSAAVDDTTATAVAFCDAFVHRLVAVDDEEFVTDYCRASPPSAAAGSGDETIRAERIVVALRSTLHELYWSKPVLAEDVAPPGLVFSPIDVAEQLVKRRRARLLLSGTRLFNALHERWCRLCKTNPFCAEEAWYFPKLVTKERDDNGAVMPGTSAAAAAQHGDEEDEHMDDSDGDSEASPMDVDGGDGTDGGGDAAASAAASASGQSTQEQESDALASSFRDPKLSRVLTSVPQALPFERRVRLFTSLLDADKARTQDEEREFRAALMRNIGRRDGMDSDEEWEFTGREKVEIRRDKLYNDSMSQLNKLGRKLRRKVQVTFINQHGALEAGIDGGGVFKEFLDDLIKDAFSPAQKDDAAASEPLFAESPVQTLQVNPAAGTSPQTLSHYEFLGRVLGKAVYESILVEPQFCLPFLNQLLGKRNALDDLKNLDPEYYRHLNALRRMDNTEIEGLGLSFEYTTSSGGGSSGAGAHRTVDLIPSGGSIPVTGRNVIRYVHLVAHRKLNADTAPQTRAFLRGFRDLVPPSWIRLFSPRELQKLISGDDSVRGIDVDGLMRVTQYAGGYHPSQDVVRWFWEVLGEMEAARQRDFLKFVTSCSRQPLLGFGALHPLPCIQQIRLRENESDGGDVRLPTSSTCMNLLKLPKYPSKELLREKLLYAIEAGAGFELS